MQNRTKSFFFFKILTVFFFFLPFVSHAEYINSFNSDIKISNDSSFQVVENIEYVFDSPKHGIFRTIPTTHPDKAEYFYEDRIVKIEVTSVLMDGLPIKYEISDGINEINIRIGDPDTTISGVHKYDINYTVIGGLSYLESGEVELYWNITGNDWPVQINKVSAKLISDDNIFLQHRYCYEDFKGGNDVCQSEINEEGELIFYSQSLLVGQGMTIAQALDPTMIEVVQLVEYKWGIILFPISLFAVVYGVFRIYKYEVKNRTGRTIIPQYEPYPGVKPMYTGLLFDGSLDSRDITACIVYLAEQGFLKIKKTEKKVLFFFEVDDYEVSVTKNIDESVSAFEKKILKLLFGKGVQIGEVVSLGDLKNDLVKQKQNRNILLDLKKELKSDLLQAGFYQKNSFFDKSFTFKVIILIACFIFLGYLIGPFLVFLVIAIIPILFILERRRSRKGYEVLDHLKGFKLFLEMTDTERFKFHNAPTKSPEKFMEYLPYAIAFGVEKEWAEVFKDITIENPDWYDGGSVNSFNAAALATSVNAFSTALASSSSPASSGGGSSGGGGGGGGGGSW